MKRTMEPTSNQRLRLGSDDELDVTEQQQKQPPPFKDMENVKARVFFAHVYFYGVESAVYSYAEIRKKKFGEKTAKEILKGAKTLDALNDLLDGTGISTARVKPYWEFVLGTVESILDGMQIALNGEEYLRDMTFFREAANYKMRHDGVEDDGRRKRVDDIHIVLGSSGSGKTAFAWRDLADPFEIKWRLNDPTETCSFYIRAGKNFTLDDTIELMKKKIVSITDGKYGGTTSERVTMTVALFIDEAALLKGKVDSLELLHGAVNKLKEKLVNGHVRLVLAGTGYDTMVDTISSMADVFKYDMKPWSKEQISVYVSKSKQFPRHKKECVVSCFDKYPLLAKVASNARMATVLLTFSNLYDFESLAKKNEPTFLGRLILGSALSYINQNGLEGLDGFERRLVARAVLGQLDASIQDEGFLKIPTFENVSLPDDRREDVISAARSLVEQNYEFSSTGKKLIDKSQPAIFVSPAITIVLFMLLDVSPTTLAGWQLLEIIGAMTLLKKAATRPIKDWTTSTDREDFEALTLGVLHTPVPAARASNILRIPSRLRSCIWVNGPLASFGDYFSASDKFIGQAKYVSKGHKTVKLDLYDECLKTGLLRLSSVKENDQEKHFLRLPLLQALSKQASSYPGTEETNIPPAMPEATSTVPEDHAYPQALLLHEESAPVQMVDCHIDSKQRTVLVGSGPPLNIDDKEQLKDWELHFFTNGKSFEIVFRYDSPKKDPIIIDRLKVNFDGEVISEKEKKALEEWTKANLMEGVILLFFFAFKRTK